MYDEILRGPSQNGWADFAILSGGEVSGRSE